MNAEFLGFSKNTVVENPVNVDPFPSELDDINVLEGLTNSGNNTDCDEYFMGACADDGVRISTTAGESIEVSKISENCIYSRNSSYQEIVVGGNIVHRSEMIIREQEVIYPVDNLTNDRLVTRSRGNLMDLPNVMKGPIELKCHRYE